MPSWKTKIIIIGKSWQCVLLQYRELLTFFASKNYMVQYSGTLIERHKLFNDKWHSQAGMLQ